MFISLVFSQLSASTSKANTLPIFLNLRLLYLFTASDFKTITIPSSIFGIIGSGCKQVIVPATTILSLNGIGRWPLIFLWVWMNLLPLNINNQTSPGSVEEDKINKGWRPLPSGLISVPQARSLMVFWYIIAVTISWILGALPPCLGLIALGFWYNRYGGADANWIIRNIINALGYISFVTGAITVAAKTPHWTSLGYTWLGTIALIICTTVQIQDLMDQEGDVARGRKTMPLEIGDGECRIISAVTVLLWSLLIVRFWQLTAASLWLPIALGVTIAYRCLRLRTVESDSMTFLIWNLWIISIYAAPLLSPSAFVS